MSPTHGRLLIHLLFLIFHLLLIIPRISTSYPDLWGSECSPSSTTGSAFKANRDLLLQSLSTAAVAAAGFFNNTVGDSPDQVFGLAMCWAYGDQETCRTCLAAAVANFSQGPKCPGSRDVSQDAAIWYNDCFLRYSNESFFSVVDTNWSWKYTVDGYNASEPDRFNRTMAQLANQLMNEAASSPQKFAVGKANFTSSDSLYGLLQCTRDLSKSDCYRCLNTYLSVLPACCYSQRGASIYGKSCYLRYEVYPFFNESLLQSSPPGMVPSHVQAGAGTKGLSGTIVVIAVSLAAFIIILTTSACLWRWRTVRRISSNIRSESLLCDFHSIRAATDNFSEKNKLGEGGFGVVYKGTLPDGQEIAAKRLVKIVGRGTEAIQNEVNLLARLEHRNLVRLLGSCIEEKEKLLVYEYMPNRSLDTFLFADDPMKRREMDWKTRLNIIKGISRGLHYLHEESRIKVIHRDLKTSNILLDENMNPKISDFGLARLFSSDRTHEATSNVAGTFGYMAPEYVRHGTFSTKSDVFSFGVLLLEVVTGRKNASFGDSEFALDLVRYARKQWNEGKVLELQDPILGEQWPEQELQRCIHIGLLCVQEEPIQRPSVEAIELMLNSYSMTVPVLQPASFDWVVKSSTSKKQTITDSDLYSNEH